MSKKISKIKQSRKKLEELKRVLESGEFGKIRRPKFSKTLKACSSVVLSLILLSYVATIYHFFV